MNINIYDPEKDKEPASSSLADAMNRIGKHVDARFHSPLAQALRRIQCHANKKEKVPTQNHPETSAKSWTRDTLHDAEKHEKNVTGNGTID